MSKKLLTERHGMEGGTIGGTPDAPVVEGVLLCGATSANRRRYLKKAFEGERVKRYDGVPVGTYHTDTRTGHKYLEQIGLIQNSRHRADGMPIGDIAVNPEKPGAKAFLWDAKHQPKACAMSHVAHCETSRAADGWEEVNELVKVESVDIISAGKAATATSIYESKGNVMGLTVKALAEALVKHPKIKSGWIKSLKLVAEMEGMDAAPSGMDAAPADDVEPADGVKEAFKSAMLHLIDECMDKGEDPKACLQKLKKMLQAHADIKGGKSEPGEEEEEEVETEESKKRKPDLGTVLKECTAAGYTATQADMIALSEIRSKDARTQFIEAKKAEGKGGGGNPVQPSRRPTAGQQPPTTPLKEEKRLVPAWE